MSTRKKRQTRRKQAGRLHEEGRGRKHKKGMTPLKAALLFLVVIGLVFAAAAIFGDLAPDGRVWSEAHQHWHDAR
jgi:hypothetical protein